MKKLKIVLLFSLSITFFIKYLTPSKSLYKDEKVIYGTVESYNIKEDKTTIVLKGKEKILINYYGKYKFKLGDRIRAYGKLIKPKNNTVFNLFNYKEYLLSMGINYTFTSHKIEITGRSYNIKYRIKNYLTRYIHTFKSKKYLMTFILCDSSEIENEIMSSYKKCGIMHLLAVSGMHITVLSNVILFILKRVIKSKYVYLLITFSILVIYMFLTDFSPSVMRSSLFFILINIKKYYNFNISSTFLLVLLMIILLNVNPYYIYNLGFDLSFIVSIYLTAFSKIYIDNSSNLLKSLSISNISFFSSAPLIINSNFTLNFFSPFYNILLTPIVFLVIYPLSIIVLFIKPLDSLLICLIDGYELILNKLSSINPFTITFSYINLHGLILYYVLISITFFCIKKYKKNYIYLIIILFMFCNNFIFFDSSISLTMIDVGQGDSILLKTNYIGKSIMIDTGGDINSHKDISNKILIPYLKSVGVRQLSYLILTHGDFDHMGEAINLVNNFKVEKVIFNCGEFNDLESELIKVLDKKKIKYYSCIKELNIDKNKLYFLQTKEYDNENDNSNVIYTDLNGYKFLFMGDASNTTEKEILDRYNLSNIDVLKVGHHGSKTSSGKEFIDEINPKYSIISVGKNNRYGHPNKEVLENLEQSKIYRTDQDGSIMFKIKNNKLKIETCSP